MKRLVWLSSILLFFSSSLLAENYCERATAEFCAPAENDGATTLSDSSSNNNDGVFASSGHPTWQSSTPNPPGTYSTYYVEFTPTAGDYITVSDVASLDITGDISIGFWMYHTGGGTYGHIVSKWLAYFVAVDSSSRIKFGSWVSGGSGDALYTTNNVYTDSEWVFVIANRSGITKSIYIDAIADSNTSSQSGIIDSVSNNVMIGSYEGGGGDYEFGGDLDEIFIFSEALSLVDADEIMTIGLEGSGAPPATTLFRRRLILF